MLLVCEEQLIMACISCSEYSVVSKVCSTALACSLGPRGGGGGKRGWGGGVMRGGGRCSDGCVVW